jgi:hypothetical protein
MSLICKTYRNLGPGHEPRGREAADQTTRNALCSRSALTKLVLATKATVEVGTTAVVVHGAAIAELRVRARETDAVSVILARGIGDGETHPALAPQVPFNEIFGCSTGVEGHTPNGD